MNQLHCPYCNSVNVSVEGLDAAAKRWGKRNVVYKCGDCKRKFSDSTLARVEREKKLKD